ncbi:LytR/AlgR family response regulator transcription factor [Pedobacter sp. N23S346]|uniref:LytR/AlgR family response regulator transcription factor n=1 Tax=Pedobacter sp. N23S346 TaxID=3402750 RepID=UPI003AC678B8
MNCLIVDDNKIFRLLIKKLISLDTSLILVAECEDAIEAHQQIMENKIDLIFLDILMPGMSGLELAKILEDKPPLIIFTTSIAEHAVEAFSLNVVDFLLKPISASRFLKAIEKAKAIAIRNQNTQEVNFPEFIFIRDSNIVRRVKVIDILYFEAIGDYVKIQLVGNVDYSIHSSLKNIEHKLPQQFFLRIHRSFIISLSKIDGIEGKTLIIDKHLVPVSDSYRANLNKSMKFL